MLSRHKAHVALDAKMPELQAAFLAARRDIDQAMAAIPELARLGASDIRAALRRPWPGALPTREYELYPGQIVPFAPAFANHEEARGWAMRVLQGQPTFAVDGSQLEPLPDLYLPVAAAQVAWFLNYHEAGRPPERDLAIEVRAGNDLRTAVGGGPIDVLRFQMEVERLTDFVRNCRGRSDLAGRPVPVCFYDGPLVVSFASPSVAGRRDVYVRAICDLIEASEKARVPVIGYVADSAASDFRAMLQSLGFVHGESSVSDAALMARILRKWGERSPAYVCARDDEVLRSYARRDGTPLWDQVGFCYLRTSADGRPSRLEFPLWILDDPETFDRTIDVVRAECIVGLGYPYCLETADQTAVLTARDRQVFDDMIAYVADGYGLDLGHTIKARSKRRRRQGV